MLVAQEIGKHPTKKSTVTQALTDCLIAATAMNRNDRLLNCDQDFAVVAKVSHLKMFQLER